MPRPIRTPQLIPVLLALAAASSGRGETPVEIAPNSILERFAVAKGGDALVLPVTVAGKERLFLLDTGCSHTVFDTSVPLGRPREMVTVNTPTGPIEVALYDPPQGSVGKLPLRGLGPVGREDLSKLREASGHAIEGVLGMDFLGRHLIRIDFDKGEVLFLKSMAAKLAEPISIAWEPGAVPEVAAKLRGRQEFRFQIDTGHVSPSSGTLEAGAFRRLLRDEELCKVGTEQARTFTGVCEKTICRGKRLALGGFAIENPLLGEDGGANRLGLTFWSRFVVTFDFPGRAAYLSEGKAFAQPDRLNDSGLGLIRRDGATLVERVDEKSPAAAAGLCAGDVLLRLGDLKGDAASLFEFRKALRDGGRCTCVVRRGGKEVDLTIAPR